MSKLKRKHLYYALVFVVVLLAAATALYVNDYYHASPEVEQFAANFEGDIVEQGQYVRIASALSSDDAVIIFYPGGKVEARAYLPLLMQLAARGYTVIYAEMPFNLAVFDIDAAAGAMQLMPHADHYYLMGHSLGGAMASIYAAEHSADFSGLILLGAYPVNPTDVNTLAIYGTHDVKLDMDQVAKADSVHEIVNGNHAYFGNYGEQAGDGTATISRAEQQAQTVQRIDQFIRTGH